MARNRIDRRGEAWRETWIDVIVAGMTPPTQRRVGAARPFFNDAPPHSTSDDWRSSSTERSQNEDAVRGGVLVPIAVQTERQTPTGDREPSTSAARRAVHVAHRRLTTSREKRPRGRASAISSRRFVGKGGTRAGRTKWTSTTGRRPRVFSSRSLTSATVEALPFSKHGQCDLTGGPSRDRRPGLVRDREAAHRCVVVSCRFDAAGRTA